MHRVVMCDRVLGYHPMHVRDQPNPPKLSAEWCQRSICWIPWWSFYLRRPPHPCPSKPFGSSDLQHVIAGVNLHWPMKPNQAWKEDQDLAGATATKPFFFLGVTHTPPPNHHPIPFSPSPPPPLLQLHLRRWVSNIWYYADLATYYFHQQPGHSLWRSCSCASCKMYYDVRVRTLPVVRIGP